MNYQIKLLTLLILCQFTILSRAAILSDPDIAEKALAATVYLVLQDENGDALAQGSGFFVRHDLIATNFHVIEGATQGTAKLVNKDFTFPIEGFVATDKTNDLALLKVTAYGIKPLRLGDSDTVRVGDPVYVTGNPRGFEGTFSKGNISAKRESGDIKKLQMTAPISPGSSGGPALNCEGEVIGIVVSAIRPRDYQNPRDFVQNLNFSIPSNVLKALLARLTRLKPLSHGSPFISAYNYYRRGNDKLALADFKGAIEDFTQSIRLKPDYAPAFLNRGYANSKLGQLAAAIADYGEAIRLEPRDSLAYFNRGVARRKLGQHAEAISDYDEAIRLDPTDAKAYVSRGYAKRKLGEYLTAISDYDEAIRLDPTDAKAYVSRGYAKRKLGEYLTAISDYDEAIRLDPTDVKAYVSRGYAKHKLGQNAAAIADYDDAIRLGAGDSLVYFNRGYAKAQLDQHTEAIGDYDEAIRIDPNYALAYHNRGYAKRKLGEYRSAIDDYNEAIRINPNYAKAYFNRGAAWVRLNQSQLARADYKTALKLAKRDGNQSLQSDIEGALRGIE